MYSGTQFRSAGDGSAKSLPTGQEMDYVNASQNITIDGAGGYMSGAGQSITTHSITPFAVTLKATAPTFVIVGSERGATPYPFYKDLIYFPNGAVTKKTTLEELEITVTGWVYYHCVPDSAGATLANAATLPLQDYDNYYHAIAKVTFESGAITAIQQIQYGSIVLPGTYFADGTILAGPGIDVSYGSGIATVTSLLTSSDSSIDVTLGAAGAAHNITVDWEQNPYANLPDGTVEGSILTWDVGNGQWEEDVDNLFTDTGADIMKDAAGDAFAAAPPGAGFAIAAHLCVQILDLADGAFLDELHGT